MTILENVLGLIKGSAFGTVAWDVAKGCGKNLAEAFGRKFIGKGFFQNQEECVEFCRSISENPAYSSKNPVRDAETVYQEIVDSPREDFKEELTAWLQDNLQNLEALKDESQSAAIHIGTQINSGSGNVLNAGIVNRYGK